MPAKDAGEMEMKYKIKIGHRVASMTPFILEVEASNQPQALEDAVKDFEWMYGLDARQFDPPIIIHDDGWRYGKPPFFIQEYGIGIEE